MQQTWPAFTRSCKPKYCKYKSARTLCTLCKAHSLNLVGTRAAESCLSAVSYFGFLQYLYNFYSVSTYRWDKLKNALPSHGLVVKNRSGTRWSARADAARAVVSHYNNIRAACTVRNMYKPRSKLRDESGSMHADGLV